MKNILLEIERCKEIEKVSETRSLPAAQQAYVARRAALEWAVSQIQSQSAAASAEAAMKARASRPARGK